MRFTATKQDPQIFANVVRTAHGQVSGSSFLSTDVFAVRYKFHALSHFPNCRGPTAGIGIGVPSHGPRKCLQCPRHEPSTHVFPCDGRSAGSSSWIYLGSSCSGCSHRSGLQGQAQSVRNNSTKEGNSMEAIGLLVTLE